MGPSALASIPLRSPRINDRQPGRVGGVSLIGVGQLRERRHPALRIGLTLSLALDPLACPRGFLVALPGSRSAKLTITDHGVPPKVALASIVSC